MPFWSGQWLPGLVTKACAQERQTTEVLLPLLFSSEETVAQARLTGEWKALSYLHTARVSGFTSR